jgi:adenylylsulfate kinase-like enzyme
VSPYKEVRESFKEKMKNNIREIYVHTTDIRGREDFHVKDYEVPTDEFIEVDTTYETPVESIRYITSGVGI